MGRGYSEGERSRYQCQISWDKSNSRGRGKRERDTGVHGTEEVEGGEEKKTANRDCVTSAL